MSTYTCQTCLLSADKIAKHLLQTRHKAASYNPLAETVECEECGDANVHVLQLVRYGLSDLALLCLPCYAKLGLPALAEYTLANGSLFAKLPSYYKFRDIQCDVCLGERNLSVANDKLAQRILCRSCLNGEPGSAVKGLKFVLEDSDDFLFALLGLKEHVAKNDKGRGHKRKAGRMGGRTSVKKVDPNAEQRRAYYESKKATEAAYKTGKTVKAVGSGTVSPMLSRSATPVPRNSDGKSTKPTKPGKVESKGKPQAQKKTEARSTEKPANKPKSRVNGKDPAPKKTEGPKTDKLPKFKEANGKDLATKKTRKTDKLPKLKDSNGKDLAAKKTEKDAGGERQAKPKGGKDLTPQPEKAKFKKGERLSDKPAPAKNGKSDAEEKDASSEPAEKPAEPAVKLPPGITKYEPAAKPRLTYDSLNDYFNEMCYYLFLEEKASMSASNNAMLVPGDFELEWYADNDKKHKQFKISILMSQEFLDRFMSKKLQALKKTPFAAGQSLILVLGDDVAWYGRIALVDTKSSKPSKGKPKRGRGPPRKDNSPKILEVVVELYLWNNMPLPLTANVNHLRILPVSVPVGRVFIAMSRIMNPKFVDLILGKKPIKQIFFKNYLKFTKDTFNDSQKVAIQSVLNNSITVLQGPPGTGKTSTIYEVILQLLENLNTYPILVVAASNIAIDNIAEKLLEKHGRSILRIVSLEKEPEYNREHPLASICLHHRVFDGLPLHLQDTIKEMRRPNLSVSQTRYKNLMTAMIDYSDKLIALARVIFSTTVVAGGNQLKSVPKMPVVIMDEATQSSEPTTLIPLSMPGVEKFVFVGDQRQLSSFSQVPNLSLSLFERIILNGSYKTPHMLDTQYRMHPAISEFPRNKFYDGLLKDGLTPADRAKDLIPANPIVFWDTRGKHPEGTVFSRFREDSGLTYANKGEISFVEKALTTLIFEKNISRANIGVITPYRGQRDLISSTLVKNELINPGKEDVHVEIDRDDFYNESKPVTIHTVSDIMIASVDAFQGREKDFLIMSCVRSNTQNKIGFLSDARRMNVALTRAKYGLILVGDVECLKMADPLWKDYIETLAEKKLILQSDDFVYG